MTGKIMDILLVEDNPGDAGLTKKVFKNSRIPNSLHVVENGEEAMDFLRNQGRFKKAVRPDIILLDLNLPGMSGHEVLQELKADDELKQIPIVILTSSKADEDIIKAYSEYANCYVSKPIDISQFFEVAKTIEDFWLKVVKLPGASGKE